jgi:hypothetical protein
MRRAYLSGCALLAAAAAALGSGCYSGLGGDAADDGASGADGGSDRGSGASDAGSDGGSDGGVPEGECAAIPAAGLRRLTPMQYRNTIRDLFGDPEFEPSYADLAPITTELGVRALRSDAELVLARRDGWTTPVFPCDTSGAADDACVEAFITDFGRRALRHPVTDAERAGLRATYDAALAELGFADAMDATLAAMLQSPSFVYHFEVGAPVEGSPNLRRLDDHELASRLSYLLWDSLPDATLFAAADAGELGTEAGLRAQVERMLADARTDTKLQHFVSQWLQLDGGLLHFPLEETTKDPELFPQFGPALQAAMRTEIEALVRKVFFEQDGDFAALMQSRDAYVNRTLAEIYGVPGPADDDTWAWVELPADQRAGLLTRSAFLTVYGTSRAQSPIRRGVFVLEEVMCIALSDPPPNVNNTPVDGGETVDEDGNPIVRTIREETELRTGGDSCQNCHAVINPVGFAFEHYDALGGWQDDELVSGLPVDASGQLFGDVEGAVQGAVQASERLATSVQVRECFADRWSELALGVEGDALDPCTQRDVRDRFVETGDMRELLVTLVTSDGFRYFSTEEGQ